MLRREARLSFEIIEVMLVTMPMSSVPTTLSVDTKWEPALPDHRVAMVR